MSAWVPLAAAKDARIARMLAADSLRADAEGFVKHKTTRWGWRQACARVGTDGYLAGSVNSPEMPARQERVRAHRVIAIAFHGMPPTAGMLVNHRDGDKQNNRPENLEWVTPAGNHQHAIATGLIDKSTTPFWKAGTQHPNSRLNIEQAREILRRFEAGETQAALAVEFSVSCGTIDAVARGRTWQCARPRPVRNGGRINHQPRGEGHHMTVLVEDDVREIHRTFNPNRRGDRARIAKKYAIGATTVIDIVRGKTWAHIYREFHP